MRERGCHVESISWEKGSDWKTRFRAHHEYLSILYKHNIKLISKQIFILVRMEFSMVLFSSCLINLDCAKSFEAQKSAQATQAVIKTSRVGSFAKDGDVYVCVCLLWLRVTALVYDLWVCTVEPHSNGSGNEIPSKKEANSWSLQLVFFESLCW